LLKPFKVIPVLLITVLAVCWFFDQPVQAYTPKEIYQKAGPGVVFIFASKGSSKGSGGTGSIITPEGLIITNAHLFTQKDSSELLSNISVFLKPDRVTGDHKTDLAKGYRGEILAYDLPLDLALVRIVNPDKTFTTVPLADSEIIDIGEQVYAIGHPEQGGLWSLTQGVISARWKNYGGVAGKNLFQTDASINRGNSGGPLLDDQASMIGINSMIARKAADGLTITDVNFSIRTKVAIDWLNQKGYEISAVKQTTPKPQIPAQQTEKPKTPEAVPETIVVNPKPPVKKEEIIPPVVEKPSQKQPVLTQEQPKQETTAPQKKLKPVEPKDTPTAENLMSQKPKQGKILTEKKPYRMDSLLEGMREMEDLMDEMKDMMDDFKERRKT
jgi:serine protease Do